MEAFTPGAVTKPGSKLAGAGGEPGGEASALRRLMESLLSWGAAGAAVGGAGAREGDGDSAFAYGGCEEEGCERCRRLVEGQRMEDIAVYGLLVGAGGVVMASVVQAAVRGVW
jgi:hypothetical protein